MKDYDYIEEKTKHCLNCKVKPCSNNGCPLKNDIPTFIQFCKEGNIKKAYEVLSNTTVLGSICGRICPHEKQCQGSCVRGIKGNPVSIGEIEAYIFDEALKNEYYKNYKKGSLLTGKKIAVVGSGPAGLTCSAFLAREGAEVTIYEKYSELGGILRHGIPEFRLDRKILDETINSILELGINVKTNYELGKDGVLETLKKDYDAVFIGMGANVPVKMNIEGEELDGVYGGNLLLEKSIHPNYEGKNVAIIGGGNVAIDCARTIKRMGAKKVYIIYRRAEKQMPAEQKEIEAAKSENIEFLFQNNIVKILGDKKVQRIECIKTELIKKEGETREVPVNIENSNYILDMDFVIMALGSKVEEKIVNNLGLKLNNKGYIQIDERYKTSDDKVYSGGDLTGQKATVAWAARAGREAAKSIIEDLK